MIRYFTFLFLLGAIPLFSDDVKPEKFLCIYFFPNSHEPKDLFKQECEHWCKGVVAGKEKRYPKPAAGSTCDLVPISPTAKRADWDVLVNKCTLEGYRVCAYNGHSDVFGSELSDKYRATEIARQCFISKDCRGVIFDSCYGLRNSEKNKIEFAKDIVKDIEGRKILSPENSYEKFVKFHQVFSSATHNPKYFGVENAITFYLYTDIGQCKVAHLFDPCSTEFPTVTNSSCYATNQSFTCQKGKNGAYVTDPKNESEQVLGKEICCDNAANGKFKLEPCEGDGESIHCACKPLPCSYTLGTKCTGYSDRPDIKPKTPFTCIDTVAGEEKVINLCCRDYEFGLEAQYGVNKGIWARQHECGKPRKLMKRSSDTIRAVKDKPIPAVPSHAPNERRERPAPYNRFGPRELVD